MFPDRDCLSPRRDRCELMSEAWDMNSYPQGLQTHGPQACSTAQLTCGHCVYLSVSPPGSGWATPVPSALGAVSVVVPGVVQVTGNGLFLTPL